VVVTVDRSGPATTAASVNYAIQNGTAIAGTDFKAASGTVSFAAGQTTTSFTVSLMPSDLFNGTRSATLVLSNPQGASPGYPSATLDLTANPPTPISPVTISPVTISPVTTPTSPAMPGPAVVSVTPLKSRRDKTSLVITFNEALNPASAQNVSNYQVSLPGRTHHGPSRQKTTTGPRRPVGISAVSYNSADHEVTLTLRNKLRHGQAYELEINGTGTVDL
jgi:hypothetical protein